MNHFIQAESFWNRYLCYFFLGFVLQFNTSYAQSYTSYVDPYIGSGGHGHVFVGASVPFGAMQLGPSNIFKGWDWCSGYNYGDSIIIGFSHRHLSGTGIGDLSDVLIMPYTGKIKTQKGTQEDHRSGYASLFDHTQEKVKPGYYAVKLSDYDIDVELSATDRAGYHKYRFPKDREAHIIIDLKEGINDRSTDTYLEQQDPFTLVGYRSSSGWAKEQQVFFAVRFKKPVQKFNLFDDEQVLKGKAAKGQAIKGVISFENNPETVEFKVGISPVSAESALVNLNSEIAGWNLQKVAKEAEKKWNQELSKVKIEANSKTDKVLFYTSMFHAMIHPSLYNDHDRSYRGADNKVRKSPGFDNYTIFSTWDTYRAAHPLYALLNPERVNDMINSMLAIYDEQGYLPVWHLDGYDTGTMVGISSIQIIAEAYLKGFRGFDAEKAFQAMKATAMSDIRGLNYVQSFKPIPSDAGIGRPVAHALEYAIADGSTALMAKAMGKISDFEYFNKRAKNYKLYYDQNEGFFRGKLKNGDWNPAFDPLRSTKPYANDYAEGNAWQYLWLVPQDVKGLIKLLGGEKAFNERLNQFFSIDPIGDLVDLTGNIGQYAHGNEPSHHIAYLYAYSGQQWKTAEKVNYIINNFYHNKPDGIIGNEDCGQMSAWYIFSSIGFYPVFPASGEYVIGAPHFKQVLIDLPEGKSIRVETVNSGGGNIYVQKIELNGQPYKKVFFNHSDIIKGGHLKIYMGNKPNYDFGRAEDNRPLF